MTDEVTGAVSTGESGFAEYYRAHTGPLVAVSLVRGADLVEAARLAQDAMAVALRWTGLLAGGTAEGSGSPWTGAQALRTWTCRMAVGGGCGVLPAAPGAVPALLGKGSADALVRARVIITLTPLRDLNERQLQILTYRLAGCAPGAIGYELGLSMPKVHRTLRYVDKLLGAHHESWSPGETGETGGTGGTSKTAEAGETGIRFADLLRELVAALDPVLDLDAGLDEVSNGTGAPVSPADLGPPLWSLDPALPVPPYGAPVLHSFAEPAACGVRAYAAGLAQRDARGREAERGRFPVAELAAVRLGAVFALQVERFRREAERSGFRNVREEFPAEDARTFAVALAQDATLAAPMFDAVKELGVARRIGFLATGLAHDDPYSNEVAHDGIEASLALAEFRRAAVRWALRATSDGRAHQGPLADALTHSLADTHRMLGQLTDLASDLSRAESTLPDGYYVDMTRDFDGHQTCHADLALGIDAARDALWKP
ncbi:hypothetical protein [Streptomyces sp. NPDC058657]|uniref:hypothetical protein n=1 Tax=unclassified Streptomyces TaxID=2593676 RepID=UPI00365315DA